MSRGHYVISFFSVSVCVILASEGYVTVWSIRFHTHTHTYTLAKVGVCVCQSVSCIHGDSHILVWRSHGTGYIPLIP